MPTGFLWPKGLGIPTHRQGHYGADEEQSTTCKSPWPLTHGHRELGRSFAEQEAAKEISRRPCTPQIQDTHPHARLEEFPRGDTQESVCYRSKTPYLKAGGISQRDLILITVNTDVG